MVCGLVTLAAAQAPGVSDGQIKIGSCSALDGPARQLGLQTVLGATAYFDYINDHGGVNGRKLSLSSFDDGYDPQKTGACFASLKRENVFAGGFFVGTPTAAKYVPMATAEHLPVVGLFTGAQFLYEPVKNEIFNLRASYNDETREQVDNLWKLGVRRIGVIYQDDGFGKAILDGVKLALTKHRAAPAATGSFTRNTLEVTQGIESVRAAKPEAIILAGPYAPAAEIVKQAHAQGWRPLFLTVSFVGTEAFITAAGKEAEGVVITQVVPPYDRTDLATVKLYRECLGKYMSSTQPSFVSLEAFVNAMVITEGLKRAGNHPTREKFITALESMNGVDIGLGPAARLEFIIWGSAGCTRRWCATGSHKYSATGRACWRGSENCGSRGGQTKPWRAALAWTAEGGRPYVVLGLECSASIDAFTLADTCSVSRTVKPLVETGAPTRISSGWHLMW